MLGQVLADHKLPRGFLDASHESVETVNGTVLLRVGKRDYRKEDGLHVHTIRDQIIEVDKSGRVVDVWDLTQILDPMRDALLGALDAGAVCVNVDLAHAGQQAKLEPDTPMVTPSALVRAVTGLTSTPLPMTLKMTPSFFLPAIRVSSKSVAINR